MKRIHNYRIITGFTIKPAAIKPKKTPSTNKPLTKILYCVAHKNEDGVWKAHINTRGLEGYEKITILDFTEKSLDLKGKTNVFSHEKDKTGHYVRVIRSEINANINPGTPEQYCTLCENKCFSGYIVKVNNIYQFDMIAYKGTKCQCEPLLTRNNAKEKEEKE